MIYEPKVNQESLENIIPLRQAVNVWENSHYDSEDAGDYSATQLINPPRIIQLQKRYKDDLILDTKSKVQAFFGTAVHDLYERMLSKCDNYELEKRVKHTINGRVITGKFDILHNKENIYDIKTARVWKLVFDPSLKEWHEQQNIYALLLVLNNYKIKSINIIAHYNDWIQNLALRDPSYPREPVVEYSLSLWDEKISMEYVSERVELHSNCESLPDEDLPECSPEDRWERFADGSVTQYALIKNREAKRATKVFSNIEEAIAYGRSTKGFSSDSFIEVRYAERKRCETYCNVSHKCNTFQDYIQKKNNNSLNDYIPLYT